MEKEERLWSYLVKTIGDSLKARRVYDYMTRYMKTVLNKAYHQGFYEAAKKLGKPGKLSKQK